MACTRFSVAALLCALALVAPARAAVENRQLSDAAANPIRKVVLMLQSMQKKVEEEGAKGKELYDQFMCYCKNSGASLKSSIAAADTKLPAVATSIKAAEEQKAQTEMDLKAAQVDRSAAKAAMAEASALRGKEAAAFAAVKADYEANLGALGKAITAIENGMFGSFLQTTAAQAVRKLALDSETLDQQDRQDLLAFLSSKASDAGPSIGDVVGILKQMSETMTKNLADATSAEDGAIKSYDELMSAKGKEVNALTDTIEAKTVQVGELGISIVQMKGDLSETEAARIEDMKFLADMKKSCASKTGEFQTAQKLRAEEIAAISETIKVLNDDETLEIFKKTLPGTGGSSFVQMAAGAAKLRARALATIQEVRSRDPAGRVPMDFIALALRGKTIGFEKVVAMIDEMIGTLKKEQLADDHKKEYCATQFDFVEDKKKSLERKLSFEESAIDSATEGIATLSEEIKALEDGIKALDKEVAKAVEQRTEEHRAFTEALAENTAAKELLLYAKNRLNKFYNPALYKPDEKQELSAEGRIEASMSGTEPPTEAPGGIAGTGITVFAQVQVHAQRQEEAPEAPAAYAKKSAESTGVIAMIDLLVKDLDKDITESKTEEKDAQADYATMMQDSAEKRAQDASSLTEKQVNKANLEGSLEQHKDAKKSAGKELMGVLGYTQQLHNECDWLIKYFDVRKGARDEEIDALGKAKAVLSGADYSALQTGRSLRGLADES